MCDAINITPLVHDWLPPDESGIEAARRMVQKYDFVITSGGIEPTRDGELFMRIPVAHRRHSLRQTPPTNRWQRHLVNN